MNVKPIKWYARLDSKLVLGILLLTGGLMASFALIINTIGKQMVLAESSHFIEQTGDGAVATLNVRSKEIAALTRTIAQVVSQLPKSESTFQEVFPSLFDFNGDHRIAGGGIWPEPERFSLGVERRSFFWGRDRQQKLQYYDDYNSQEIGYHREEWYVIAPYLESGQCFWSRAYIDPYSQQPMVTCTVGMKENGEFWGAATIDLKLEGLQAFLDALQKKTGGYIFIVDRNNRFITLPNFPEIQQLQSQTPSRLLDVADVAEKYPKFYPFLEALESANLDIVKRIEDRLPQYQNLLTDLEGAREPLTDLEMTLIAAAIADPLQDDPDSTRLLKRFQIDEDWLLLETATAYIFYVPDTYWKLVIVKPVAEAIANYVKIVETIVKVSLVVLAIAAVIGIAIIRGTIVNPIERLSEASWLLASGQLNRTVRVKGVKELELLSTSFNQMAAQLKESFQDLERSNAELDSRVEERTQKLKETLGDLQATQAQLIQSEKMSSLGQLVAGIAHEINNPISFIYGNLIHLEEHARDLKMMIEVYQKQYAEDLPGLDRQVSDLDIDLDFIYEDLDKILYSMKVGADRIKAIVISLRNFSRLDEAEKKDADLHEGLDSTLLILNHRLENTIQVIKNYRDIPLVLCCPSQLNQVFINIISNAIDVLIESDSWSKEIEIATQRIEEDWVRITIRDNGPGIPETVRDRIFDPFFTTKPIGRGTGLGLSVSYQIVVDKHQGRLSCHSTPGEGTEFVIEIPIKS